MRPFIAFLGIIWLVACRGPVRQDIPADEIVNKSITAAGGVLFKTRNISFVFRDRAYQLENTRNQRILKRLTQTDTGMVLDVKGPAGLHRFINGSPVVVPDSMAVRYANSVNAVHYFAYLPYGLNDPAVNKRLLGEVTIKGRDYYKIEVTFDKKGGGKDYEDIYVYWIGKEDFAVDYLAYLFHSDGGGIRFREAYNKRVIGGIRFADYRNYEAPFAENIYRTDSLFQAGSLKLLSLIKLREIKVNQDSYN